MKTKLDYIVIGQGLAGSMLAWKLLQKQKKILIIDELEGASSSKKASGLINPITGRRFVKSWKIDELIDFALKDYTALEFFFGEKLIQRSKVHRILQSVEQQNDWASKAKDERYAHYLQNKNIIFHDNDIIKNKFGCIEIEPVLKIDTPKLIQLFSKYFEEKKLVLRTKFDYNKLEILGDRKVIYNTYEAKKIIFCEGFKVMENPFFKPLDFVFSKGETLWFEAKELLKDFIIGGYTNIIPLEKDLFSIGASYAWNDTSLTKTKAKKRELSEKLEQMISCPFKIVNHKVGIRPTVKDRRPIIGLHQEHKNLCIFNGLGTKGLSLAPYFAEELVSFLEEQKPLSKEINVERFYK